MSQAPLSRTDRPNVRCLDAMPSRHAKSLKEDTLSTPGKETRALKAPASVSGHLHEFPDAESSTQALGAFSPRVVKFQPDSSHDEIRKISEVASSLDDLDALGPDVQAHTTRLGSTQLLRIVESTNDILLTRTQMRHQLETLRGSRSFLEASLDRLVALVNSEDWLAPDAAHKRTDTATFREHGFHTVTHQSTTILADDSTPESSEDRDVPSLAFSALMPHLRQDLERVRQQEREFSTTLESLSTLEYRLTEKLKALADDLRDPEKATRIVNQNIAGTREGMPPLESPRPESEIPSVVERYFDQRGNIGVWFERREELLEAWAEGIAEREFIADRGDELEVSDEEFNSRYADRQEYIDMELHAAQEEADHWEQLCREAGFDVEAYRTTRRSETGSEGSERQATSYSTSKNAVQETQLDTQALQAMPRQPTRRIDSWLRSVASVDVEPADDIVILSSPPQSPRPLDAEPEDIPLPPWPNDLDIPPPLLTVKAPSGLGHEYPLDVSDKPPDSRHGEA